MLENCVVTAVGYAVTVYSKKGDTGNMHGREWYGLSFCGDGRITYVQDGNRYVSDKHSAVLLPKGAHYTILRQETGQFPVVNFDCTGVDISRITVFPLEDAAALRRLYEELCESLQEGDPLKARAALYGMLSEISRPARFSKAQAFIRAHLSDPALSNRTVARHLGISETGFGRQFKSRYGITPKQFVQKARMDKASRLLCEGGRTLTEIAQLCGYTGLYSFSRAFKNYTGMAPTAYQKDMRSGMI